METLLVYETIARVSNALAMTVGASQTLCFDNFRRNATEQQKMDILPKACSGEYIGCLGITEPNAGSDAMGMTTRAVKVEGRYVINGSKTFITNGPVADFMLFYAKTDSARGSHGISAFYFLTEGAKGLHREKIKKWGMRSSPTALITFEDMGTKVAADAVQIHRGYGYCPEYAVSRHYLDQKLWDIGAGTAEVRRMIIARELLRDNFLSVR